MDFSWAVKCLSEPQVSLTKGKTKKADTGDQQLTWPQSLSSLVTSLVLTITEIMGEFSTEFKVLNNELNARNLKTIGK